MIESRALDILGWTPQRSAIEGVSCWESNTEGRRRRFFVKLPDIESVGPTPVLLELHGSGQDSVRQMRTSELVSRARCAVVVVAEAGIPFQRRGGDEIPGVAWNIPGVPLIGEVGPRGDLPDDIGYLESIRKAVDALAQEGTGDWHIVGFSGGARLGTIFAAESSRPVRSLIAVAGLRSPIVPPTGAVQVLAIHGRDDDVNPFAGGAGPRWSESVEQAIREWSQMQGGDTEPDRIESTDFVSTAVWNEHTPRRAVLLSVSGHGHSWPGSPNPLHKARSGPGSEFDATGAILDFLGLKDPHSGSMQVDRH